MQRQSVIDPAIPTQAMTEPDHAVLEPHTRNVQRLIPRYRVLIHNDEITPMDFVVYILMEIFKKELQEAMEIMLTAHRTQLALVAILTLEEAEFRIEQAHAKARTNKFPLTFTCEPE